MKPSAVLLSIGLLSSGFTAVTVVGHLAWTSLTKIDTGPIAQSESAPVTASDQSGVQPIQPRQPPGQTVTNVSTAPALQQIAPKTVQPAVQKPTPQWTQQENDYLFHLSQALQPIERNRLRATDQIAIARNIQTWIAADADYWGIREQFDANYRGSIAGDYAHNRDVYIRFATAHFAPDYLANVMQPPRVIEPPAEFPLEGSEPYPMPYPQAEIPYPYPYGHPNDFPAAPYPYPAYPGAPYPNSAPQVPAPQFADVTEVAM